jgi:hypothetical protein
VETQAYQAILERNAAQIIPRPKEILAKPDPALGYFNGELRPAGNLTSMHGTGGLILSCEQLACQKRAVTRAPFALLVFVVASAFAESPAPEVIFISPCECEGFHGKNRWIAKTDLTPVPLDKSADGAR